MHISLGYLGVGTSDTLDAWRDYAEQTLGVQSHRRPGDGALVLRFDEHDSRIVVHPGVDDILYVGWEVDSQSSLRELRKKVEAAGTRTEAGTADELDLRGVQDMFWFADPDGTRLEVHFGPNVSFSNPFKSPLGLSGFVTGAMGLGHIVLSVRDLDATLDFYCHVMGFSISDFMNFETPGDPIRAVFLHCNRRHHSLAFIAAPLPVRLHHFMLQVNSLDDVGVAWDCAKRRGDTITMDLGRHTNDHMVSFYVQTPSKFEVEFGFGAREIDDDWSVVVHSTEAIWGHHRPGGEA